MPRIDIALVYVDGRKEVVSVGRPADLIAFADKFDKLAPSEPHAIRELAWLAHRALRVEQPLDQWVETLDELTGEDDVVAAMRAELDGPPTGPPATLPVTEVLEPVDGWPISSETGSPV
jgi:hypothetical protein